MATPSACSQVSSRESEPVKECRLVLTTLSGSVVEITTSVAKYDRLEDLEDHVVDYLASVTDLDVFGCTLDFVHPTMQTYLEDPIWEVLQTNTQFTIVLRDCLAFLHSKESFDGCPYRDIPQAVQVPTNLAGIVPAGAFIAVPRLRHVSVEAGINAIGAEAWQSCRHLRVVRMPSTVVRIAENTFRGCQLLNSITAPGCVEFGYKAFADCCSLQRIHANGGGVNQFRSATTFGQYLFRDCINLATFALLEDGRHQEPQTQAEAKVLPTGCLSLTGITTLELTRDFQVLGAHACDNCKVLKHVDISNSSVEEIQEFTFVHCASLCEVRLPYSLHTIRVKAFMNCAALPELAIAPSLHYIASRAFLDCASLCRLTKLPGRHRWRGTYAEENAFAICPAMRWPPWLHMIPDQGYVSGLA